MKEIFSRLSPFQRPIRAACSLLFLILITGCAHQLPAPSTSKAFNWNTDRFAFANETVFTYDKAANPEKAPKEKEEDAYSRRCFVMSRATLQFRKFARFDSQASPVPEEELAKRVRLIASTPVWEPELPLAERIVLPGSSNLFEFSSQHAAVLQKEIGAGWPTYFRAGNMAMPFPVSHDHQQRTAEEMQQMIRYGQPAVLWLTRFPSLAINHSVLAYAVRENVSQLEFEVYDPNYTDGPKRLTYDKAAKTFSYQKTFYFKGGPVIVRTVYWSHLQ